LNDWQPVKRQWVRPTMSAVRRMSRIGPAVRIPTKAGAGPAGPPPGEPGPLLTWSWLQGG
jgi:hypothetical protein